MNWLRIRGLSHCGGALDFIVHRHVRDIAVNIERSRDVELNVTI